MNKAQQIVIAIVTPITSGVSLLFASIALTKIFQSNRRLMTPPSRMLGVMCVAIIISSIASVFSTVPIPKETEGVWMALGTTKTCELQGFFFILGSCMIPMYSGSLCMYYMCVVNYNMSDERFGKRLEPSMHISIILWSIFAATSSLATGSINDAISICWIAPLPGDCVANEDIECFRGEDAYFWRTVGIFVPGLLSLLIIIISLLAIFKKVTTQELSGERFRFSPSTTIVERSTTPRPTSLRHRAIKIQMACYLGGGCLVFLATGIFRQREMLQQPVPFALILVAKISYPLQGFVNIAIFIRPSAAQIHRMKPSVTWFEAFRMAFNEFDGHTEKEQTARRRRSSLRSAHGASPHASMVSMSRIHFSSPETDPAESLPQKGKNMILRHICDVFVKKTKPIEKAGIVLIENDDEGCQFYEEHEIDQHPMSFECNNRNETDIE